MRFTTLVMTRAQTFGKDEVESSISASRDLSAVGVTRKRQGNTACFRANEGLWIVSEEQIRATCAAATQSLCAVGNRFRPVDSSDQQSISPTNAHGIIDERYESRFTRAAHNRARMIEVIVVPEDDKNTKFRA